VRLGNELLLYLASRNNLQAPKEVLVEVFFPERDISRSYNQIYVNIHRFNKAFKEKFPALGGIDFIFIRQGIVYINNDILEEVDTQKFRKIMSVAGQLWLNDKDAAIELMEQAADMFSTDIAPGFYYLDWLDEHRTSLVNMQLKALSRIFHYHMQKGSAGACSEAFYNLIELDPLNEDFYIEYIRYILKDGRDAEAMNLYRRYEAYGN
jgi:DNA-binding SARP family transcriptional activator